MRRSECEGRSRGGRKVLAPGGCSRRGLRGRSCRVGLVACQRSARHVLARPARLRSPAPDGGTMKVPALAVPFPRSAPVAFTSELRPVGRRDVLLEVLYCG